MSTEPHEAKTHPDYPDGFPVAQDRTLFGRHPITGGVAVVEEHLHGYELHILPCAECEACRGGRYRECFDRGGPILTVAGDHPEAVVEYLAVYGSERHEQIHKVNKAHEDALWREQSRQGIESSINSFREDRKPGWQESIASLEQQLISLLA